MTSTDEQASRLPDNPFLRYRTRLNSYQRALDAGWTDAEFVNLVERIDEAIVLVDGRGFEMTPFTHFPELSEARTVWVKDDTGNVSGSHKSRHLFGVALALAVDGPSEGDLAIASCGNAAIAASVIAKAIRRPLRVFIPTWADEAVRKTLESNDALVEVCPRQPGESGDPTYLRFTEAVAEGAVPFSVQSTATSTTIDGGRTLGWELADQIIAADIAGPVDVFIQIGGGALATSTWLGLTEGLTDSGIELVLHAVQTEACAPLIRAWEELTAATNSPEALIEAAMAHPDNYMRVWEPVGTSAASGILDDVAYDWLPVVVGMAESGGWPVLVHEPAVVASHADAIRITGIDAEPTGTSGFAALYEDIGELTGQIIVLFTGVTRR